MWDEPPWKTNQCISWQGDLPRITFLQKGWREAEHQDIIDAKDKISKADSQEEWELRKKITNPYEAIFSGNSDTTFPSLAKVYPLSRSYFKMIEILEVIQFWKTPIIGSFRSAHVCEGPGGFLQAIIEKLKTANIPTDYLYAMTLKPTKSHIPGWRRSIQFLKKYPQIQLEYGADDTGNILIQENQRAFCERVKMGANIFTADGGFDFSVDYSNQEQMAFPLLLASFTIGLGCLAKGGTMIIKLFDIYSPVTQDLFLATSRLFEKFTLYKPATSRPCNSERYFIAMGYTGQPNAASWIRHLEEAQVKHAKSPLTRLVEDDWPIEIMKAVYEHIEVQEKQQIRTIHETLHIDVNNLEELVSRNIEMSKRWCEDFGVPYISI